MPPGSLVLISTTAHSAPAPNRPSCLLTPPVADGEGPHFAGCDKRITMEQRNDGPISLILHIAVPHLLHPAVPFPWEPGQVAVVRVAIPRFKTLSAFLTTRHHFSLPSFSCIARWSTGLHGLDSSLSAIDARQHLETRGFRGWSWS